MPGRGRSSTGSIGSSGSRSSRSSSNTSMVKVNRRCGSKAVRRDKGRSPVLKQRLIVVVAVAVLVSGCAAGRAFRQGQDAARAGDWDAAVQHYTRALQANPDNAQYKIELERAMQNAGREYISRARELEEKGDIDAALIAYRRAVEMDGSNRLAAGKVIALERAARER